MIGCTVFALLWAMTFVSAGYSSGYTEDEKIVISKVLADDAQGYVANKAGTGGAQQGSSPSSNMDRGSTAVSTGAKATLKRELKRRLGFFNKFTPCNRFSCTNANRFSVCAFDAAIAGKGNLGATNKNCYSAASKKFGLDQANTMMIEAQQLARDVKSFLGQD